MSTAQASPTTNRLPSPTRRRRPHRAGPPRENAIAKANALRRVALPWHVARYWPGLPVVNRRKLFDELGVELRPTELDILAHVRKAVRAGFPGLHVSAGELGEHLCRSRRQVFRALAALEELGLVRRVHGYVEVGGALAVGGGAQRWYRNRQTASVLVLGPAARLSRRRRCVTPQRVHRKRDTDVTPKPALSLPQERERRARGSRSRRASRAVDNLPIAGQQVGVAAPAGGDRVRPPDGGLRGGGHAAAATARDAAPVTRAAPDQPYADWLARCPELRNALRAFTPPQAIVSVTGEGPDPAPESCSPGAVQRVTRDDVTRDGHGHAERDGHGHGGAP